MMKRCLQLVFCIAISTTTQLTLAQESTAQDGVKVGEKSWLTKLGSNSALEQQAAQQYAQTMQQAKEKKALAPDHNSQVKRLRAIADRLKPHVLRWNEKSKNWNWEVNLIASDQVNAYCMPGGKIAFYTGILDKLKLTDDEVAMIMGHEMAHALREHSAGRQGASVLAGLGTRLAQGIAAYKGYDPDLVGAAVGGAAKVGLLKFSRTDETDADIVGLDIAARAGFDPRAGVVVWKKMGMTGKSAPPQWLSTHPSGNSRIAEITSHLPEVMPLYAATQGKRVSELAPYRTNVASIPEVK
jgi:predicted Zn-dependent protease